MEFNNTACIILYTQCHIYCSTLRFSDIQRANVAFGDSHGEVGIMDIINCRSTPFSEKHGAIVSSVHYVPGSQILVSGSYDQRGTVQNSISWTLIVYCALLTPYSQTLVHTVTQKYFYLRRRKSYHLYLSSSCARLYTCHCHRE